MSDVILPLPPHYKTSAARLADLVWLPLTEEDAISELWLVWSAGREINAQMENMMTLLQENRA